MKREVKDALIQKITEEVNSYDNLYLADIAGLDAEDTTNLRRKCFEKEVKLTVVKNTLLKRALDAAEGDYHDLYDLLKENTSVMFANTANAPGKIIKEFRKEKEKPILKGAYAAESFYIGDETLEALASLKSKEELLGDIVMLLQSPMKTLVSQLQSGGQTLAGVVKTLSEKEEN